MKCLDSRPSRRKEGLSSEDFTNEIKLPKMVTCPACGGRERRTQEGIKLLCPVSDNSGITTKGYEKKFLPWQIERIRQESGLE